MNDALSLAPLRRLLDQLDDGVLVADSGCLALYANPAFSQGSAVELGRDCLPSICRGLSTADAQAVRCSMALGQSACVPIDLPESRNAPGTLRLNIAPVRDDAGALTHWLAWRTCAPIQQQIQDVTQQREQEAQLRHMAMYDELTDLPNRRLLQSHLDQAMARCHRRDRTLAVCMLDLDGFKPVNDLFGHDAGDQVLVTLGQRITQVLRKTDLVARLGGDEFVLLIEDLCDLEELAPILDKVQAAVAEPIALRQGTSIRVGTSMGVCFFHPGDDSSGDQLLRFADQALYESKSHKFDRERCWAFFGESMQTAACAHFLRLLDAGALELVYQPVLANKSDSIVGVEVLPTLRGEDGLLIGSQRVLRDLDVSGLRKLLVRTLSLALRDLVLLDTQSPTHPLWLFLAVDSRTLDADVLARLGQTLAQSGIAPQRITLGLSGGMEFFERENSPALLHGLKAMGVRLALNYAGSAFVSPLLLESFPLDMVKLGSEFAAHLEDKPQGLHFIRVMQNIAMELKVDLLVAGVQSADVLDAMMTTGLPFLQGQAISAALPLDQLVPWLAVPRGNHAVFPQTLFGYYAGTIASHNSIKRLFMINPSELNIATLGDSRQCRGHAVQERLGCGEGTTMAEHHEAYHRALGIAAQHFTTNFKNPFWDAVEVQLEQLLQTIILEWRQRRGGEPRAAESSGQPSRQS